MTNDALKEQNYYIVEHATALVAYIASFKQGRFGSSHTPFPSIRIHSFFSVPQLIHTNDRQSLPYTQYHNARAYEQLTWK